MDMFEDELADMQALEIMKLKESRADIERDCRQLNMVYKSVMNLLADVSGEGQITINTEGKHFIDLWRKTANYDPEFTKSEKYTDLWSKEF